MKKRKTKKQDQELDEEYLKIAQELREKAAMYFIEQINYEESYQ